MTRAWIRTAVLGLLCGLGAGCIDRLEANQLTCAYDADCLRHERCVSRRCALAPTDAGPAVDSGQTSSDAGQPDAGPLADAGTTPIDAGVVGTCAADFGNDTALSALAFDATGGAGALLTAQGGLCGAETAYFKLTLSSEVAHVAVQASGADLVLNVQGPNGPVTVADGDVDGVEALSFQAATPGLYVLAVSTRAPAPVTGLPLRLEAQLGSACYTAADCSAGACRFGWRSTAALPGPQFITPGACVAPRSAPCGAATADPQSEGDTAQDSTVITLGQSAVFTTCALDQDVFRVTLTTAGDLTLTARNPGPLPGSWALHVRSADGGLLSHTLLTLGAAESSTVRLLHLPAGTYDAWLTGLSAGAPQLTVTPTFGASICNGDASCLGPGMQGGRDTCSNAACVCTASPTCAP